MNRAERRQAAKATKAKPGRGRADPFSYLRAIGGVQPFTTAEKTQLCLPVRMAYEAVRTGKGDAGDFDTLAVVVNTCLIRAEQIAPELVTRVIDAQDALMRIKERGQRTGRLGLDYQAMADLLPIIDLHEQLIDLSAPVQMRDALLEVMTRMNRGQVLQPASPALEP